MTHPNTTHGESRSRLYSIWSGMRRRCRDESHPTYRLHGARGIRVCDEWQRYEPFRDWAREHGYDDHLVIDRIDNDGNYEPDNCRWVTTKENLRNTSYNKILTALGETKTMVEWSEDDRCVVRYSTVKDRVSRLGWDIERAIRTPERKYHDVDLWGEVKTIADWARDPRCLVSYDALKLRLRRGWAPEEAMTTPQRRH